MLPNGRLLSFLVLVLVVICLGGCSNAKNYKVTFLKQTEYKGTKIEEWINSCNNTSGYYQLINSDPDSWEMVIYYPNINPDLKYIYYNAYLEVGNGNLKIYLTESNAVNDSEVVKDLVLHISAPVRGARPTTSDVFINNEKVECLGQKN